MSVIERMQTWLESDKSRQFIEQRLLGGRILKAELGPWPRVYRTDTEYRIVAQHTPPAWVNADRGLALLVGTITFLWVITHINSRTMLRDAFLVSILYGLIAWLAFWIVVRPMFKTTLRFRNGELRWRNGFARGKIKEQVDYRLEVKAPHRKAAAERLKSPDGGRKPVYGVASELLIQSGPRMSYWQTVAAIGNDPEGMKSGLLKAAIHRVHEMYEQDLQARRTGVARGRPDGDNAVFR